MLERALPSVPTDTLILTVVIDDSVVVAYANGVAFSCRFYGRPQGDLGLFVDGGTATFSSVSLFGVA
jgi:hypothetical protein